MDGITVWRGILIATGVVLLVIGGLTFLREVGVDQYPGVAVWLAGAIVLHDGVGAMAVFGVTVLARRVSVIPFIVVVIVQAALAVVAIVVVVVAPEIVKSWIGTANPSILPLDYLRNLVLFTAGVAVATAVASVIAVILTRRSRRPARTG